MNFKKLKFTFELVSKKRENKKNCKTVENIQKFKSTFELVPKGSKKWKSPTHGGKEGGGKGRVCGGREEGDEGWWLCGCVCVRVRACVCGWVGRVRGEVVVGG